MPSSLPGSMPQSRDGSPQNNRDGSESPFTNVFVNSRLKESLFDAGHGHDYVMEYQKDI